MKLQNPKNMKINKLGYPYDTYVTKKPNKTQIKKASSQLLTGGIAGIHWPTGSSDQGPQWHTVTISNPHKKGSIVYDHRGNRFKVIKNQIVRGPRGKDTVKTILLGDKGNHKHFQGISIAEMSEDGRSGIGKNNAGNVINSEYKGNITTKRFKPSVKKVTRKDIKEAETGKWPVGFNIG